MNVPLFVIVASLATITSADFIEPSCPVDQVITCAVRCNVMIESPICAIPDGWQGPAITLQNQCVLLSYNCNCSSFPYKVLQEGECPQYIEPTCPVDEDPWCAVRCDLSVGGPVCATTSCGQATTFQNSCALMSYNCRCYSSQYELQHEGEC